LQAVVYQKEFEPQGADATDWLNSLYASNKIPSLSVAVGVNGRLAWTGTIGHANLDQPVLADQDTAYRIGSISKPITAAAFMRMSEKGLINLDDSYNDHVEDYASGNASYTLR